MIQLSLRALAVHDNGNGTVTLELHGRELSPDEQKVMERLFPNLIEGAYRLLNQEALLASIATPSEVSATIGPRIDPTYAKAKVPIK